jgi:hypothetical protein
MSRKSSNHGEDVTIEQLYPDLSPEEREEAEVNLRLYIELIIRIHERIQRDNEAGTRLEALTPPIERSTIR